jgi:cysteinyl-tRNA synthetase
MSLKLYNTATRRKETFLPLRKGEVSLYACGVTVYDLCHVGHARSAIVFDVLVRYLRARGFQVTYVRNFTDVDDKIIDRANLVGKDPKDLAQENIDAFYEDMGKLGVLIPDAEPRATEFIPHMVEMIRVLTDRGYAYEVDGDVFFAVDKFESYGKLSGRRLEDMKAGSRVAVDEKKRRPMDFALWKRAKPGEPNWPSPWGPGRPGWHIECSVMSSFFLGPTFDIHGGGEDLLFPHHENERAQSVAATGGEFARYWVHNGFVTVESEKMSKSLGNFLTIRDALALYHPEVLRLFLLSKHYRSPLDFAKSAVLDLQAGLVRIYRTLQRVRNIVGKEGEKGASPPPGLALRSGRRHFPGTIRGGYERRSQHTQCHRLDLRKNHRGEQGNGCGSWRGWGEPSGERPRPDPEGCRHTRHLGGRPGSFLRKNRDSPRENGRCKNRSPHRGKSERAGSARFCQG